MTPDFRMDGTDDKSILSPLDGGIGTVIISDPVDSNAGDSQPIYGGIG